MNTIAYLQAFVGADVTSFRRGMAQVRSEITATAGLGSSLQNLGGALTLGLTAPIAAIAGIGLKTFMDLDETLRNVNSIAGLTEEQFQALTTRIMEFGETTRDGSNQAAQALYTIVSAGYGLKDINEAFVVMEVAVATAEAGLSDYEITTQAIVSGLLAYNETSQAAAGYSDALTRAVQVGVGTMEEFAGSVGLVLPTSAALKVTWEELLAVSAFLTQRGLSPSEAFVSLNGAMRTLLKPGEALTAVFAELGVTSGSGLIEKFGSFEDAIIALGNAVGNSPEKLAKLFPEIRAFRGIASIINNVDAFSETMTDFRDAVDGATDRSRQEQMKSFAYQFDRMITKVRSFLEQIGRVVAPIFMTIVDGIGAFLDKLLELDPAVVQTIVVVGLLVAALPPLIWLVGTLLSPLGALIAIVVLVKKAFDDNFLGIKDLIEGIVIPAIQMLVPRIIGEFNLFLFHAGYFINNLKAIFEEYFAQDLHNLLFGVVVGDWELVKTSLGNLWGDIGELFRDKFQKPIEDFLTNNQTNIIQKFVDLADGISVVREELEKMDQASGQQSNLFLWFGIESNKWVNDFKTRLEDLFGSPFWVGVGNFLQQNVFTPFETGVNNIITWIQSAFSLIQTAVLDPIGQWWYNSILVPIEQLLRLGGGSMGLTLPGEVAPNVPGGSGSNLPRIGDNLIDGSWNSAAGYPTYDSPNIGSRGGFGNQTNNITIQTNNADQLIQDLRAKGVDLTRYRRG